MGAERDEPILLQPRLDPKPWGGRRLAEWGLTLPPDEPIGEALLTAPDAVVASGRNAGATLEELVKQSPWRWAGTRGLLATGGRQIFPLLIKFIDARENLSIQVHPDDCFAAARHLGTGKTEAHYVLDARPGAALYLGLRDPDGEAAFAAACLSADGSAVDLLRRVPAEPGATFVVPAGTVHAIGAGAMIYEIQQPSHVTYRLDDWGRLDSLGLPRDLHLPDGLSVLDRHSRPETIAPIPRATGDARRELLAATRYFALERITLRPDAQADLAAIESPRVLTVIAGDAAIEAAGPSLPLAAGQTAAIPTGTPGRIVASREATILHGWVPDLEREILIPGRQAGVSETALQALGIAIGEPPMGADGEPGQRASTPRVR
jgi:mannose-6-phosphate isomerase